MKLQRSSDRDTHLELLRQRYAGRGRAGRSRLLDEFCDQYGYERKYAIKLAVGLVLAEKAAWEGRGT